MNLAQLVEVQRSGALVVSEANDQMAVVGGQMLTTQQCNMLVRQMGWTSWEKKSWEIITKTDKFIKGLVKHLTNTDLLVGTDITFLNRRVSGTMKYFDRIHIGGNDWDITILYGMPGSGGTYVLYDGTDNNRKPVATARSLKQLVEFINESY